MDDLISRQAAIDALMSLTVYKSKREIVQAADKNENSWIGGVAECIDEIEDLQSAHPEREKGNWVYGEDEYGIDGYHCDKCGFFVPWEYGHAFINYIEDYNFCPSCGADMRGEQ